MQLVPLLKKKGKKTLFYHQDGDGVSSAALVLKFFSGFHTGVRENPQIENGFVERIVKNHPDVLLFLDLSVDQEWKQMKKIGNHVDGDIVVIDHHIPERDLKDEGMVHINPRFERKEVYIPTSYIIYRELMKEFGQSSEKKRRKRLQDYMWLASVGVVSDYAFRECRDFLLECKQKHPELIQTEITEEIFQSELGKICQLISSAITLQGPKGAEFCLETMVESEKWRSFRENRKLNLWNQKVGNEINRLEREFEEKRRIQKNVLIFEVESELNVTSMLASILARKNPDHVILLRKRSKDGWKVSIRSQKSGRDLGELVKQSAKGMGMGGGHERAAGAFIRDWEKFKERFLESLEV